MTEVLSSSLGGMSIRVPGPGRTTQLGQPMGRSFSGRRLSGTFFVYLFLPMENALRILEALPDPHAPCAVVGGGPPIGRSRCRIPFARTAGLAGCGIRDRIANYRIGFSDGGFEMEAVVENADLHAIALIPTFDFMAGIGSDGPIPIQSVADAEHPDSPKVAIGDDPVGISLGRIRFGLLQKPLDAVPKIIGLLTRVQLLTWTGTALPQKSIEAANIQKSSFGVAASTDRVMYFRLPSLK